MLSSTPRKISSFIFSIPSTAHGSPHHSTITMTSTTALRNLQRRRDAESSVATAAVSWLNGSLTQSGLYEAAKQVKVIYSV